MRRTFGDLKVRLKLIVLHNLFFLVLLCAVYVSLLPILETRARLVLFGVLGLVYLLAVAVLEFVIMPRYVYRPIATMLDADEAARSGDAAHEFISESQIPDDEIGQIMRSRNATIAKLRHREAEIRQVNLDLIRKNELLETAKRNIEAQDRLASLGMLSASVAHEINTPLAVLQGSIEKLMETIQDRPAQERLERMQRVTGRLRRMSASLVDFARVRQLHNEMLSLRALVEESWGLVAIDDKAAGIRFENGVPEGEVVHGNSDRLIQLFVNLLRNALLAVQSGGYIGVHCARYENGWVSVFVDDDGPGIPADVLPHIFEAFVTSRLDARGTGLGLTVAEGIAHEHGGSIHAENRPGRGARLEVKLPAATQ